MVKNIHNMDQNNEKILYLLNSSEPWGVHHFAPYLDYNQDDED